MIFWGVPPKLQRILGVVQNWCIIFRWGMEHYNLFQGEPGLQIRDYWSFDSRLQKEYTTSTCVFSGEFVLVTDSMQLLAFATIVEVLFFCVIFRFISEYNNSTFTAIKFEALTSNFSKKYFYCHQEV